MTKIETPKWSTLRVIGNSTPVRLTVVMPFIGYLILFNSHVVDALNLALDYFPQCQSMNCSKSFILSRLYFLYFGLCFLGVGASLYQLRCNPYIKRFDTAESFTASISPVVTSGDLYLFQTATDAISGPSPSTRDFLVGELTNLERASDLKLSILNNYYRSLDASDYASRSLTTLCYILGFSLVLFPSVQTSVSVFWSLLKFLREP